MSGFIDCPGQRCGVGYHVVGSGAALACGAPSAAAQSLPTPAVSSATVEIIDVDYQQLVTDLAADCVNEELSFITQMAAAHKVDLDDLCTEVMRLEDEQTPKSLSELMAQRASQEQDRLRAEAELGGQGPATDEWGFLPANQIRSTFARAEDWMRQIDAQAGIDSLQWAKDLDQTHLHALDDYTGSGHHSLNQALRYGTHLNSVDDQMVALIDGALEKLPLHPAPVTTYRGMLAPAGMSVQQWLDSDFEIGTEVQFPTYLSTTWDPAVALGFTDREGGEGLMLEIKTRQGAPLSAVSTFGSSERERLLPRETVMEVVGVHRRVPFESKLGMKVSYHTVVQLVEYSCFED